MISRSITPPHGLIFGFRWSLVGICLALFYIASCDLFIPPDSSKPRFNKVYGEKRRPELNPGGQNFQSTNSVDARQQAIDAAYGAGEPTRASQTLTTPAGSLVNPEPLPPAPAAAPAAEPAQAPAPKPQAMREEPRPEKSFWSRLAFWSDEEEPVADAPASERRMPAENLALTRTSADAPAAPVAASELAPPAAAAPMQVAASDYPKLYTAPENPGAAANDGTRQRLGAAQAELEADRVNADAEREKLARDAVAEPSLLESLPAMRENGELPPLPPPPAGAGMRAPAPVTAPVSAKPVAPAPVAKAPVVETASVATAPKPSAAPSSTFERLTSHPLERARPTENPEPVAKAETPAPAAPAVIAAAPAPKPMPAPKPAPVAAPEVASVTPPPALRSPASASVEIAPPPAVASVSPPPASERPALEPIRLTPPSGMQAEMSSPAPKTMGEPIHLTQPNASYADESQFLPNSRYLQRSRM